MYAAVFGRSLWLLHNLPAPVNGGSQIDFSIQEELSRDLSAREAPWWNVPSLLDFFNGPINPPPTIHPHQVPVLVTPLAVARNLSQCHGCGRDLVFRAAHLWKVLFPGKGGACPQGHSSCPQARAPSPWEQVPVPLVLNMPSCRAFVESWLKSKLYNPQNVMAFMT